MSTFTIQCCDLCGKPLSKGYGQSYDRTPVRRVSEIKLEMYGALGGWGHGRDVEAYFVRKYVNETESGKVCNECFAEFTVIVRKVNEWLEARRDINWKEPDIPDIERRWEADDNVSGVRPNEPQRERRQSPVLRILSHVPRLLGMKKKAVVYEDTER